MVEKKEGAKMDCLNCGNELTCGWSKESENFKAKLQWQNSNGKAHYKFEKGTYLCIDENGEVIETEKSQIKPTTKSVTIGEMKTSVSEEQKLINCTNMIESLWPLSLEKSKEVYGIKDNVTNNKDVMILAQVFFKAMVESYLK